jgi:hypothetical protein
MAASAEIEAGFKAPLTNSIVVHLQPDVRTVAGCAAPICQPEHFRQQATDGFFRIMEFLSID